MEGAAAHEPAGRERPCVLRVKFYVAPSYWPIASPLSTLLLLLVAAPSAVKGNIPPTNADGWCFLAGRDTEQTLQRHGPENAKRGFATIGRYE